MTNDDYWVGSEEHRIRVNEIDFTRRATLPALLNLMQEVAWNNSAELKYSVYDLMKHGVTWVVYRMQIHFNSYPGQQELLKVESWPSGMDRLYTYRDYRISNEKGKEIVRATSAWLVMDIEKRELVTVPAFIRSGLDFGRDIERVPLDLVKLKPVQSSSAEYRLRVSQAHIDQNNHVYNTHYFQWILETMVESVQSGLRVEYIDIQFKGESRVGDELIVTTESTSERSFLHQIKNMATGKELIRARTEWNNI